MESNQAQVIRQDLRNFSGAVQNMVQGVRAASISWGDRQDHPYSSRGRRLFRTSCAWRDCLQL